MRRTTEKRGELATTRPRFDVSRQFGEAVTYALRAHRRQTRKATDIPYMAHLLAVAALVLEHGGDEDEAIASLLHDAPEDQGGRRMLARIRRQFGPRVATIVEACTDTFEEPKPPWRPRKEAHIEHVRRADPSARLVIAADKLHNLQSVGRDFRREGRRVWQRFHVTSPWDVVWYYGSMLEAIREANDGGPPDRRVEPMLAEISRLLAELARDLAAAEPAAVATAEPPDGAS